jgi:hypothetical protein
VRHTHNTGFEHPISNLLRLRGIFRWTRLIRDVPLWSHYGDEESVRRPWVLYKYRQFGKRGVLIFVIPTVRYLAWPSVLFGLNTMFNAHPLRAKEGGAGWSNMAYVSLSLFERMNGC